MRGTAVSFLASRLNDETKKPIKILRALNVRSWNNATNRFFNELINDTVALSGMRFFYLSRRLILAVSKKKKLKKIVFEQSTVIISAIILNSLLWCVSTLGGWNDFNV